MRGGPERTAAAEDHYDLGNARYVFCTRACGLGIINTAPSIPWKEAEQECKWIKTPLENGSLSHTVGGGCQPF